MRSHVRVPKCVIKQFCNGDNMIYYSDFMDGFEIKKKSPKLFATAEDYYSPDIEE